MTHPIPIMRGTVKLAKVDRNRGPEQFGPHGVYVGRNFLGFTGGPLANLHSAITSGRIDAVEHYRHRLKVAILDPSSVIRHALVCLRTRLECGEDLVLYCWCFPNLCHAEVIAEAIESWEF